MLLLRNVVIRILLMCAVVAAATVAGAGAANAAVPDVWGFAFVNTTSGVPSPAYQAGSWAPGPTVSVTSGGSGEYFVRFPKIGIPRGGVAHVTAISQSPEWCQIEKWWQDGPDEVVAVRCTLYGGGHHAQTLFSVVFASSSGALASASQAYGYVYWDGGSIASHYNSALATNSVAHTGTGAWTVVLPGLGSAAQAGNIQVTAVDSGRAARCKVGAWDWSKDAQKIRVLCHDATDVPLDTGWTLTYQRQRAIMGAAVPPKYFAYTFDNDPSNPGPYAPAPAGVNYNYTGAVNTLTRTVTGRRWVAFPSVGVLPSNVQVTAYGSGPEFCNLVTLWVTAGSDVHVRDVFCYRGNVKVDSPSLVTYTSQY
ncbi:hypothetical protein [Microbispora sp. NPDC049633]|uniref:hypothetical protein n=1 Tax=Microbispora sp. NPDC049633 TaxID=3154355 RepID=UPI003414C1DB